MWKFKPINKKLNKLESKMLIEHNLYHCVRCNETKPISLFSCRSNVVKGNRYYSYRCLDCGRDVSGAMFNKNYVPISKRRTPPLITPEQNEALRAHYVRIYDQIKALKREDLEYNWRTPMNADELNISEVIEAKKRFFATKRDEISKRNEFLKD